MKLCYDGALKGWFCGNGGMWKAGNTPQEAVANWRRGLQ